MLMGNVAVNGQYTVRQWDTRPTTDLKYPDKNVLPILNASFQATLFGNIAQKSCLVYHHSKGDVAGQCCRQWATRWDTGPTTDLNYPDRNVLPIFNWKVPKQQSIGKIAQQLWSKSCPV